LVEVEQSEQMEQHQRQEAQERNLMETVADSVVAVVALRSRHPLTEQQEVLAELAAAVVVAEALA
jgi:hypothetical protein